MAQGVLQCAFYHVKLPPHVNIHLGPPVAPNRRLSFEHLGGAEIGVTSYLQPFVTVMPTGWPWALHFC